jgi:calcium-dependent protein kinase
LHSIGVCHRDIKFENIMIFSRQDGEFIPKFIDFGLSKVFLEGETSADRFGTLVYTSPEILLGYTHSFQTDIWSLGVVIYVLLSGSFPFVSEDKEITKRNIVFEKLNLNNYCWQRISQQAKDLIL